MNTRAEPSRDLSPSVSRCVIGREGKCNGMFKFAKVIIGEGWRFSIEIRGGAGYAPPAFWQQALALKRIGTDTRLMRKWSCTRRRMVEIKCCGTIRRLRCFFSSNRVVESATHRHYWKMQDRAATQGGDAGPRPLQNFPFVWITPALDEWGEKEGGREKKRQEEERKKEGSGVYHTHTHTHTVVWAVRVAWSRKWQMRTGGEEIMIAKRYRVPPICAPKDFHPLNLGLISEKNAMIRIIAMIDGQRTTSGWATPEYAKG